MMLIVYFAFLIISLLKLLYFTYLFQIKEYRFDRMKSFLKEEGFWKTFYLLQLRRPGKSLRNSSILAVTFIPTFFLFLYLTEIHYIFGIIIFLLSPIIAFAWISTFVALTSIPVWMHRLTFILRAKWKVKSSKTVFIGVTGSYGKSTVKEYLYHILSSKYKVAKTDKNMNTDVGVALSILKNLNNNTQYFVAEVGAYKRGEITAAVRIFKPTYGIITALGNQHLDLFGSKENLVKAKFELIDILPDTGKAYINADTLKDKELLKSKSVPSILYSQKGKADIYADNIRVINSALEATITYGNKNLTIRTQLLGNHNIMNLLPCIAIALDLGMTTHEVTKAIASINALPGKLSQHTGLNEATIINNSYNSNVDGFIASMKTLKQFPQKNKLIISRGIIELGQEKGPSYQRIMDQLEKTALQLWTTDPLFKTLNKQDHVKLFKSETQLLSTLKKDLHKDSIILIEGRFPEQFIDQVITK